MEVTIEEEEDKNTTLESDGPTKHVYSIAVSKTCTSLFKPAKSLGQGGGAQHALQFLRWKWVRRSGGGRSAASRNEHRPHVVEALRGL
jgi:hypothetical protein